MDYQSSHLYPSDSFWSNRKCPVGLHHSAESQFKNTNESLDRKHGHSWFCYVANLPYFSDVQRVLPDLRIGSSGMQSRGISPSISPNYCSFKSLCSELRSSNGHCAATGDAPNHERNETCHSLYLGVGRRHISALDYLPQLQGECNLINIRLFTVHWLS